MKIKFAAISVVLVACEIALVTAYAGPHSPPTMEKNIKQIVVRVQRGEKGLDYELETEHHKKGEANFMLAELKLQRGGDCQIIALVDDRAPLSAITEISEMAINAGFKDIRPFVFWHKTGRMAQVQFGPPIKFTGDSEKIQKREKKEISR
jgi:hypothetical protein